MVGYGGVAIVSPSWTNLGKEHSIFWFVTLDCGYEPKKRELKTEKNMKIQDSVPGNGVNLAHCNTRFL